MALTATASPLIDAAKALNERKPLLEQEPKEVAESKEDNQVKPAPSAPDPAKPAKRPQPENSELKEPAAKRRTTKSSK